MIRLFEIHEQLSASLGDVVYCSNSSIPDGARYSKQLRDSYLYRAILETYRRMIANLTGMPRKGIVSYLQGVFPNLTYETVATCLPMLDNIAGNVIPNEYYFVMPKMVYIYGGYLLVNTYGTPNKQQASVPINMQTSHYLNSLKSSRHTHIPDLMMSVMESENSYIGWGMSTGITQTFVRLYDYADELSRATNSNMVNVYGLKLPNDPSKAVTGSIPNVWCFNSFMEVEDYMVGSIIAMATMYALFDSQEIQQTEQFLTTQLLQLQSR